MLKTVGAGILSAMALVCSADAAGTGSTVTFQGEAFVIAAPSACGTTATVGDFYRLIYRAKVASSDPADAVAFIGSRSEFRILSTSTSGSLNGASTTSNAYFDSHVNFQSGLSGTTSLTFSSFQASVAVQSSTNIKVSGTVTSFFGVSGCDITMRGVLTLRPTTT